MMVNELASARRQQMGVVLEDLVEQEHQRLVAAGRIIGEVEHDRLAAISHHPAAGRLARPTVTGETDRRGFS